VLRHLRLIAITQPAIAIAIAIAQSAITTERPDRADHHLAVNL
jgi:hypothetical protein